MKITEGKNILFAISIARKVRDFEGMVHEPPGASCGDRYR